MAARGRLDHIRFRSGIRLGIYRLRLLPRFVTLTGKRKTLLASRRAGFSKNRDLLVRSELLLASSGIVSFYPLWELDADFNTTDQNGSRHVHERTRATRRNRRSRQI